MEQVEIFVNYGVQVCNSQARVKQESSGRYNTKLTRKIYKKL